MDIEALTPYGFDVAAGLARCIHNRQLYTKILQMFLQDTTCKQAQDALARHDLPAMFAAMHELKGACGNLGMTVLYREVCGIVETLRAPKPEETILTEQFSRVREAYDRAREGIAALNA